jgi:hypothetical protein
MDIPKGIQHVWNRGLKAREILRKTIKIGYTAGEMLDMIVKALEAEGFVYTPSDDVSSQYRDLMNALGDSDKSGFSIDCHTVGNTGNSEIELGPSMAPFRPFRSHLKIQQNNIFAFEFVVLYADRTSNLPGLPLSLKAYFAPQNNTFKPIFK